jgi:hypothetical protein
MKLLRKELLLTGLLVVSAQIALAQKSISTAEARDHVGEYSKVCGHVASAYFAYRSRGAPTFINLDRPYPAQVFTALIWAEDRSKFGSPETQFDDKNVCVSGVIQLYRGLPEIIVRNPSQIQVAGTNSQ